MVRFAAVLAVWLFALAPSLTAAADSPSLNNAINVAGSQRMLTQRMLKAYSAIGIDVNAETAALELREAVARFDRQLGALSAGFAGSAAEPTLHQVKALWLPYKALLEQPVSRANATQLLRDNDALLRACHKVVLVLEDMSGTAYGQLVNVAGRQRMLSQRMAKFYLLRAWGFDNAEVRYEIDQARNEFRGALGRLLSAPENTSIIAATLVEAEQQWNLFEHSLKRDGENLVPLIVANTSERLLEKMNEITGLYEQLSGR